MVTTNYGGGQIRPHIGNPGAHFVSGNTVLTAIDFRGPVNNGSELISGAATAATALMPAEGFVETFVSGVRVYIPYYVSG